YLRAPGLDSRQQIRRRESKMKAHDRRLELAQRVGGFVIEGQTPGPCGSVRSVDSKLPVVGRERRSPQRFSFRVERRRLVAEEVYVVRLVGLRPDRRKLIAHRGRTQHRTR